MERFSWTHEVKEEQNELCELQSNNCWLHTLAAHVACFQKTNKTQVTHRLCHKPEISHVLVICCTVLLQATSHDLHGAGGEREGEKAREETGG